MSNQEEQTEKSDMSRRPVASASIGGLFDAPDLDPETAHRMISELAVALLCHVSEQLRSLSIESPSCAEPVAPTLRMIREVSEELEFYRGILEHY